MTEVSRWRYREVFFAQHGAGPYDCFHCGDEVEFLDVIVHHFDDDKSNNTVGNLVAAHPSCHKSHHNNDPRRRAQFRLVSGMKTDAHRAALSHALKTSERAIAQRERLQKQMAARTPEERSEAGRRAALARWSR